MKVLKKKTYVTKSPPDRFSPIILDVLQREAGKLHVKVEVDPEYFLDPFGSTLHFSVMDKLGFNTSTTIEGTVHSVDINEVGGLVEHLLVVRQNGTLDLFYDIPPLFIRRIYEFKDGKWIPLHLRYLKPLPKNLY